MSDIFRDYSFGGWLKHFRLERKITLREAAKKLEMDVGNLSKMEHSRLDPPFSAKKISFIGEILGFNEDEIDMLLCTSYSFHVGKLKEKFWNG